MLETIKAPQPQRRSKANWSIVPFGTMAIGEAVKLPKDFANIQNIRVCVGAKGDKYGKKFSTNVINGDVYITRRA